MASYLSFYEAINQSLLLYKKQEESEWYYIDPRYKDDDKVRSTHAVREGKIFNKHIPPEDGTPGEAYNCRCWAEPKKSAVPKKELSPPLALKATTAFYFDKFC